VVAEGIETEEQMRQVKAHGCHEGQGHFFGEPMPAEIIRARLAESTSVAQLVA
jgi:EAL domain-containing protein (putative c-di-GMP-specific phosphodiesterase class I)